MTIEDKALIEGLSDGTKTLLYYSVVSMITEVRRMQFLMLQKDQTENSVNDFYTSILHEASQVTQEIQSSMVDASQLSLVKHFATVE